MEVSISPPKTMTTMQPRLLQPPSDRLLGSTLCKYNFLASSGSLSLRSYVVRNKAMKAMSSISGSFQPVVVKMSSSGTQNKKQKVPCYQKQEALEVEARSMAEVYDALAEHLLSTFESTQHIHGSKYIVGLAGPPGAGKSTIASEVVRRVNVLWSQKHSENGSLVPTEEIATMLPMDGFHLYRSQLDAMEDPKEAHARRGAPWTFNPELLLKCLHTLRKEGSVYAPSFDHGVGDPVENDIFVKPEHKIVVVEGNYLLLEEDVWKEAGAMFDEKWFIDIDIDVSMQRVLKRHIATGKEPDIAAWRISYNDRPNAELVMKSKKAADLVIRSPTIQSKVVNQCHPQCFGC